MRSLLATLLFTTVACSIGNPGTPTLVDSPPPPDAAITCLNGETPGLGGPLNPNDGVGGGSQCGAGMGGSGQTPCVHQVGTDCMSCHGPGNNVGQQAPLFTIGGTLYADPGGTTPLGGAIIEITAGGQTQKLVTANNGNFYALGSAALGPYTVKATQCPGTHSMAETQPNGSCNASGCHDANSATGRAYLVPGQP